MISRFFRLVMPLYIPLPEFVPEASPAFVEDNPDAGEPQLAMIAAPGAAGQQPFGDHLVAICELHGYAVLNLLYLRFP